MKSSIIVSVTIFLLSVNAIPTSVDWRDKNIITPAKYQDNCGSQYAFAVVAGVESAIAQKTGKLLDLSEQQVIDCSYMIQGSMNNGCYGGHEVVAMDFIAKNGLVIEQDYTYTSGRSQRHNQCKIRTGPYGKGLQYRRVSPGNETALAEAVAQYGPMIVSISGENRDFQLYRGGIYDNPRCPQQVDHVVQLIGYGTENGRDYWLIKNSWGSRWGDGGIGKILRGVNQCGIVSDNSWSITV